MDWIKRYLLRGLPPLILGQAKIFIVTLVAMIVSVWVANLVYSHGGLVWLIGNWMAVACATTGLCNFNSLEFGCAVILIAAVQSCLMIARMLSLSDNVGAQVQEDLEDADLLAAVIGQKGKAQNGTDGR